MTYPESAFLTSLNFFHEKVLQFSVSKTGIRKNGLVIHSIRQEILKPRDRERTIFRVDKLWVH